MGLHHYDVMKIYIMVDHSCKLLTHLAQNRIYNCIYNVDMYMYIQCLYSVADGGIG